MNIKNARIGMRVRHIYYGWSGIVRQRDLDAGDIGVEYPDGYVSWWRAKWMEPYSTPAELILEATLDAFAKAPASPLL